VEPPGSQGHMHALGEMDWVSDSRQLVQDGISVIITYLARRGRLLGENFWWIIHFEIAPSQTCLILKFFYSCLFEKEDIFYWYKYYISLIKT
jgi:hypothetical protein